MLQDYYKHVFQVKLLSESVDSKKIVRKTYSDGSKGVGTLVTLGQSKIFQSEKESVEANYLFYCAPVSVKIRDKLVVDNVDYEVVQVLSDIKNHHVEIYLRSWHV